MQLAVFDLIRLNFANQTMSSTANCPWEKIDRIIKHSQLNNQIFTRIHTSLTKSSFSGSYRVLTQYLKARLCLPPPLVPAVASGYSYQKGYIGSLMRSVGSPGRLYQKGHIGILMSTWFPQPNYQYKISNTISFQCPLMSNHEIYDIGAKIVYEPSFDHNSTQKAPFPIKKVPICAARRDL